ncbi:hypothetical protein PIB30_051267 [Stylosanthes scabra]|uniref:Uncharacterized protein n=1 Tax=Stylosanthes scabra TaxID=79078 RepID=A0ABU6SII6_9FABA|nr:hypothetical protein [Stylosanthes scabra]
MGEERFFLFCPSNNFELQEGERKIVSTILFLLSFILLRIFFFPYNSIVVLPSFPKAFALLLLIISQVFLEMAENQPENQEAVVPAAGAVQIPRELPFIYRWVANDVLGTPSSLDQQYLDELKLTGVLFGGGDLERRYRVEAARRGERVCFMNLTGCG